MNLAHMASCFALAALACSVAHAGNVVPGDCTALKAYIKKPGVQDDDGNPHPGYAGWTLPRFDVVGNYTNQRSSTKPGEFCFTATAHPQFTTAPAISTLDWQPTGCNVCACQLDRDRWMEGIRGHEQNHANGYRELVKNENAKKRRPFQVKACFSYFSTQKAIQEWNNQVAMEMELPFNALKRSAERDARLYDKIAIGDDPQCDNCKPCGPTAAA